MKKILFILLLTIPFLGFGQCGIPSNLTSIIQEYLTRIDNNDNIIPFSQIEIRKLKISLTNISIDRFYLNGEVVNDGLVVDKYSSGKIKSIWKINSGVRNGLVVGFYEKYNKDECFKYSYIYQYSYGSKYGDQYEFYQSHEKIPLFNYNFNPNNSPEYTINYDDQIYYLYGNRDNGLGLKEGEEWVRKQNRGLSFSELKSKYRGSLHVEYEGLPIYINKQIESYGSPIFIDDTGSLIPKLTESQTKLFTLCFGIGTGCFWKLHWWINTMSSDGIEYPGWYFD